MPDVSSTQTSSEDTAAESMDTKSTAAEDINAENMDTEDSTLSPDDEAEGAGEAVPDPAAFLAYVTMQMDVRSLASALLSVFDGQAWRAMGLVADPMTGQTKKNMPDAQIAIDCVQFLLGKVENELPEPERREMQRRLNDLRMNYVMKLRES